MKITGLASIVLLLTFATAAQTDKDAHPQSSGPGVIVYAEGGAFVIEGPKGWIADHDTGQKMGICCVFYPEGATFDDATTIIYPNIATKGSGQANLKELMAYDLAEFQQNNPDMTYDDAPDLAMKNKRIAKVRYFHGVNKGSSEATAYIDEDKIVAMVVVSSRTQKGLDDAMPILRDMLQSYAYMDVKFAPGAAPK